MAFPLSVLDLSPIDHGLKGTQALRHSIALARQADQLGYTRYWLAEHHNTARLASSSPEILIGHIAQATTGIRVGSGGIMLPNHAPLKVAERFCVLAALYPDRIDLGVGRAPGTDHKTELALRRSEDALGAGHFAEQLGHLFAFSGKGFPVDHPFHSVRATPSDIPLPPVWLLGSSDKSAYLAAARGLGFAFAHHINPQDVETAMHLYQEQFQPSAEWPEPRTIVATSVVCAETDERLEGLAASMALSLARTRGGHDEPLPSPTEALAHACTPRERALVQMVLTQSIIGTPGTVKEQLERLMERTNADELMVTAMFYGHENRVRLLELLAHVFDLQPRTLL